MLFPNNLRQANSTQFRVLIDDTHTWHVHTDAPIFGLGPVPGGGQATTAEDPRAIRAR